VVFKDYPINKNSDNVTFSRFSMVSE
jgi:hypothetical protein